MDFAMLRNSSVPDDQEENIRSSIVIRHSNLKSNYASITSESPQIPANLTSQQSAEYSHLERGVKKIHNNQVKERVGYFDQQDYQKKKITSR